VTSREAERSKNFFALGLMSWLYHRPVEGTLGFIETKFAKRPEIVEANTKAFKAGWNYGETSEDFAISYEIAPAKAAPGTYRQVSGTRRSRTASSRRASSRAPLFLGAYPITPASGRPRAARSAQALRRADVPGGGRDRRLGAALGAAFGGALGVTTSAGRESC
jgi:2-oxoglutarate ferredoxin oxidoreductase subunit alpha